MTDIDIDANQRAVDAFNASHLPGAWVRYWTGTREDPAKYGQTRSGAELLGGHTPGVWVTTHSACIALTHVDVIPGQPDNIEDDSRDLPEPRPAAERVGQYIAANGDGIYDVLDGHPLYARDIEALRRAGEKVAELTAALAANEGSEDARLVIAERKVEQLRAELAEVREHLNLDRQAVATLRQREQEALAALTESRANAAKYAAEVGRLVAENARLRQQRDELKPIVEAAKRWRSTVAETGDYENFNADELTTAVDALPKAGVAS
ncbi:hypothetical protein ACFYL6_20735 [Micromonospora sp. NPDC007208]|uniref:hypothetical protein n=1 Tax=Micromonospora sp. NPDC007208 TaxID=3364236 RepID=UPI00368CC242